MALNLRLIDATRVVVEATRDLQVGNNCAGHPLIRSVEQLGELTQALFEQFPIHAEASQAIPNLSRIGRTNLRHLQQHVRLIAVNTGFSELGSHTLRTDLVDLVQATQGSLNVRHAEGLAHALDDLAVVDEHAHRRDRQIVEGLGHHERQIDLEVEGQLTVTYDVDIRLREFTEATILRTLAAPHLLDLVALEREVQFVRILNHVAGERNGQVEVQTHSLILGSARTRIRGLQRLQSIQNIDLLGGLTFGFQLLQGLNRPGFDTRKPVQFKHAPQLVKDVHLDDAALREPFGET